MIIIPGVDEYNFYIGVREMKVMNRGSADVYFVMRQPPYIRVG